MRTEVSVEIERPIDEVFEFANEHIAQWSMTVVEDEVIEEQPGHVGSTFRCVTEERGKRMEFVGTVTRYDRPRASAVQLVGASFDLDVEYTFEDRHGSTRMTQRSVVIGKGLTKVILVLCGWMMRTSNCRAAEDELENLKRLLESRNDETRNDETRNDESRNDEACNDEACNDEAAN